MGSLRSSLKCFMKVMRCQPGIPCCGGSGLSHPRAMYSSPRSSPCPINCMSPAVLPVLRPWVLMPSLTAELLCECSRSSKMRGHVSFLPSLRSPSWANSSSRDYMLLVRAIFYCQGINEVWIQHTWILPSSTFLSMYTSWPGPCLRSRRTSGFSRKE
jgi:hypothetical protein